MMCANGHYACSLWKRPTYDDATEEASNNLGQILVGQTPERLVFSADLSGFLSSLPSADAMCDALWVAEEPETLTHLYSIQVGAGAAALVTQTRQCSADKLRELDESLKVASICFQATRAAYKAAPRFVIGLIDYADDAQLYAQQAQAFARAAAHGILLYDMPSVEAAAQALRAIRPVFSRPIMCCVSRQALLDLMHQTTQTPACQVIQAETVQAHALQTAQTLRAPQLQVSHAPEVSLTPKQLRQQALQHIYQHLVEQGADAIGFSNVSTSFARSVCKDSVDAAEQFGCGCLFIVTDATSVREAFLQDIDALIENGVRIIGVGNTSNADLVAAISRCMYTD